MHWEPFAGRRGSTAILLALAILAGGGSGAAAQTLKEALSAAYLTNPDLQAGRAGLRATDETVSQALGGWRPVVTLSGGVSRDISRSNSTGRWPESDRYLTPHNATISVSQPLFRGFRTEAGVDIAENNVRAERARLRGTEEAVLLAAVQAYLNVVRDQAVLNLNQNNVQVLTRQLEATQDRFRVGEITRTDVAQAEARLAGAVAAVRSAEGFLATSRANFERVVGTRPGTLEQPEIPFAPPADLAAALEQAKRRNSTVVAANFAAQAAEDNIRSVRGELLPTVSLTGSATASYDSGGNNNRSRSASVGLSVSVPIYEAGVTYARLRAAMHTAGQRALEVEESLRLVQETVTSAWETYQAALAAKTSILSQIEAAEIALEGVQREAQVGSRTVLDVLDAEQELLNARVDLVSATRDEAFALFQLQSATGLLTASGLGLDVPIYDPTVHYREVRDQWWGLDDVARADAALARKLPEPVGELPLEGPDVKPARTE